MFQEASECEALAKFELFKQVRRRRPCEHRGGMPVGESPSRIAQRGAAGMRGLRREPSCADGGPGSVGAESRPAAEAERSRGDAERAQVGGSQMPPHNGAGAWPSCRAAPFKTAATVRLKGSGRQLLVVT